MLAAEEEETPGPPVDRASWEARSSKASVALVDDCLGVLRRVADGLDINYKRNYIGLTEHGQANNFVIFVPKKNWVHIRARLRDVDLWGQRLESAGIEVLAGGRGGGSFRFNLRRDDIQANEELIRELFAAAYGEEGH